MIWFIVASCFIIAFWSIMVTISVLFSIPMSSIYRVVATIGIGVIAAELADRCV